MSDAVAAAAALLCMLHRRALAWRRFNVQSALSVAAPADTIQRRSGPSARYIHHVLKRSRAELASDAVERATEGAGGGFPDDLRRKHFGCSRVCAQVQSLFNGLMYGPRGCHSHLRGGRAHTLTHTHNKPDAHKTLAPIRHCNYLSDILVREQVRARFAACRVFKLIGTS